MRLLVGSDLRLTLNVLTGLTIPVSTGTPKSSNDHYEQTHKE